MRDRNDNVVIVCSIENVDPMGVHTGDSVTVAPQQTLTDRQYQALRDQAIAVHPGRRGRDRRLQRPVRRQPGDRRDRGDRDEPARVALLARWPRRPPASRSPRSPPAWPSATRSRRSTTTSPGARPPPSSRRSTTSVVKWPRFAFEKFPGVDAELTTHMKSVGEVMAIGRTFQQAFAKAMRSRELDAPPRLDGSTGRDARAPRDARRRALRPDAGGAAPRRRPPRSSSAARRSTRGSCTSWGSWPPTRTAPFARRAHVQGGRHLRRRVRGRDALLLLGWERARGRRRRGRARRPAERGDPRRGPQPHRPGDRVRLLLRPRGDGRARPRAATP